MLDNLNKIQNLIVYTARYTIGAAVEMKIKEKLAAFTLRSISLQKKVMQIFRQCWAARGLEGEQSAMQILMERKYELKLCSQIKELAPKVFIIAYKPKTIHGGFWVKQVRKGKLINEQKKNISSQRK